MSTTSPISKLAQGTLPDELREPLEQLLAQGLGEMSLRQLLGMTLSGLAAAERSAYLEKSPTDKGNGSYDRSLGIGSLSVPIEVPRTRSGWFRPTLLPAAYQRVYPNEMQQLLLALLCSSRSVNAAKAALKKLGLPCSEDDLEAVASEYVEQFALLNSRPLDPDLIALFVDAKYVEVKDSEHIRPTTIYLAVGLTRSGHKRVLACMVRPGRENLEDWKRLLRSLLERGLRRLLILIQDDFPGLLGVTKGLFAQSDIQLCIVHMQRNAKNHLSKADVAEFQQRLRMIKASYCAERAANDFEELCLRFESSAPAFIAELRKKRDHYLRFLDYPQPLRRTFSTTNAVEAVNGQLERLRLNNGGYFHSEPNLQLKLGIATRFLEDGKWRTPAAAVRDVLAQLNAMFERRFEAQT